MNVYDLVNQKLGVRVTVDQNKTVAALSSTMQQIMKPNPNRVGFIILNLGSDDAYVSPTQDVSSTNGILLASSGGNLTTNVNEDFVLPSLGLWGVSAGTPAIFVLEIIITE